MQPSFFDESTRYNPAIQLSKPAVCPVLKVVSRRRTDTESWKVVVSRRAPSIRFSESFYVDAIEEQSRILRSKPLLEGNITRQKEKQERNG